MPSSSTASAASRLASVAELGKHVIVVLHDINFAPRYADRIVAMRDGAVVADAAPREVMVTSARNGLRHRG